MQRLARSHRHCTVAFVEPLGLCADLAIRCLPVSTPIWNIFIESVMTASLSFFACMELRVEADPKWVSPVPVRWQCAGSSWWIGKSIRPSA